MNRKAELESALLDAGIGRRDHRSRTTSRRRSTSRRNEELYKDGLVSDLLIKLKQGAVGRAEEPPRPSSRSGSRSAAPASSRSSRRRKRTWISARRAAYDLQRAAARRSQGQGRHGRRAAVRLLEPDVQVERGAQVGAGHQPRARRRSEQAQSGTAHRGDADQGHPHRPGTPRSTRATASSRARSRASTRPRPAARSASTSCSKARCRPARVPT